MENVALVAPAATVTLEGTRAAVVLLLDNATAAPPVGAAPLSVTVPVDEFPPVTLVGFNARELSVTAGGAAGCTVCRESIRLQPNHPLIPNAVLSLTAN